MKYIVFEGHDNAGKTSIIDELEIRLNAFEYTTFRIREPNLTPNRQLLGKIHNSLTNVIKILNDDGISFHDRVTLMKDGFHDIEQKIRVFTEDRRDVMQEIKRNSNVDFILSDRSFLSTLVYQTQEYCSVIGYTLKDCGWFEDNKELKRFLDPVFKSLWFKDIIIPNNIILLSCSKAEYFRRLGLEKQNTEIKDTDCWANIEGAMSLYEYVLEGYLQDKITQVEPTRNIGVDIQYQETTEYNIEENVKQAYTFITESK